MDHSNFGDGGPRGSQLDGRLRTAGWRLLGRWDTVETSEALGTRNLRSFLRSMNSDIQHTHIPCINSSVKSFHRNQQRNELE